MQDETALYGAKMMQPGMTAADSEENNLRPQHLEDVGRTASAAPAAQGAGQAIAALVSLGYSQSEAALAVSKIDATLPVEEIIKLALRGMAGRR